MKHLVLTTYGTQCHLCGGMITVLNGHTPDAFSIDHVVPLNAGGAALDLANCKPAHIACNSAKQDRSLQDFTAKHVDNTSWALSLK